MIGFSRSMPDIEDDSIVVVLIDGVEHSPRNAPAGDNAVLNGPGIRRLLHPAIKRLAVEERRHPRRQGNIGPGERGVDADNGTRLGRCADGWLSGLRKSSRYERKRPRQKNGTI